jgi:hypothetical protein
MGQLKGAEVVMAETFSRPAGSLGDPVIGPKLH